MAWLKRKIAASFTTIFYFIQDVGSEVADDRCQQSDKAVKLSAVKLQIELTYGDVLAIGTISL